MNWYRRKTAESYTGLLSQQIGKLFPRVAFSMSMASGTAMFVDGGDGELYEIRIEPSKYAGSIADRPGPIHQSQQVLQKIEASGLFNKVRQVGGRVGFIGIYQPDFGLYSRPSRDEYLVTVRHWLSSPYKSYFENTKMPPKNPSKDVDSVL